MKQLNEIPCNVEFDFLSPHNGEYWYKCSVCGDQQIGVLIMTNLSKISH